MDRDPKTGWKTSYLPERKPKITLEFIGNTRYLKAMYIVPGCGKDESDFFAYATLKKFQIRYFLYKKNPKSFLQIGPAQFEIDRVYNIVQVPKFTGPEEFDGRVKIEWEVLDIFPGTTFLNTVCIGEIVAY